MSLETKWRHVLHRVCEYGHTMISLLQNMSLWLDLKHLSTKFIGWWQSDINTQHVVQVLAYACAFKPWKDLKRAWLHHETIAYLPLLVEVIDSDQFASHPLWFILDNSLLIRHESKQWAKESCLNLIVLSLKAKLMIYM